MADEYRETLSKHHKLLQLPYDEMCKKIMYEYGKTRGRISIRDLAKNLDLPTDVVREALGYSDMFQYDYEYWRKHFNRKDMQ